MAHTLAVYVLLDTSASMHGLGISALREGLPLVVDALGSAFSDWQIHWSAAGYSSTAQSLFRRESLTSFTAMLNSLVVGGASNLGQALATVQEWAEADTANGEEWLLLIFTDGPGTDDWEICATEWLTKTPQALICGVGCGIDADLVPLDFLLRTQFNLIDSLPNNLVTLFKTQYEAHLLTILSDPAELKL